MPVTVVWDDEEKTVVRFDFVGQWTWDEAYKANEVANAMLTSVSHTVSSIINLTGSAGLPSGALTHARRMMITIPDNSDISIVVGSGAFVEALLRSFSTVYKKLGEHYKMAHTLDEARALIAKQRAK